MASDQNTNLGEVELTETEIARLRKFVDGAIGDGRAFETNVKLAESAHLSEGTIRKIRKGLVTSIKGDTFDKLARAFGFQPSQFKAQLENLDRDAELKRAIADEIRTAAADLPEEDQQEILEMIRLKRERQQRRAS